MDELLTYCDAYEPENNEMFFNHRHNNLLDILDYYRSSALHISTDCCPISFAGELSYWGLEETSLEPCCLRRLIECKEQLEWEKPKVEVHLEEFVEGAHPLQQTLWDMFEHPHTSTLARVIGTVSVSCIFISTIILTLETLPYFQDHGNKIYGEFGPFMVIEAMYMAYFTVEFIIRLITCPNKCSFLKQPMNWIDLLAIVPYFFTLTLNFIGVTEGVAEETATLSATDAGEPAGRSAAFAHSHTQNCK